MAQGTGLAEGTLTDEPWFVALLGSVVVIFILVIFVGIITYRFVFLSPWNFHRPFMVLTIANGVKYFFFITARFYVKWHDTIKGTDVLDWLEYSFTFLDFCSKAGAQEMPKTCGLLLSSTVFELHAKFEANRSVNSRDKAIGFLRMSCL